MLRALSYTSNIQSFTVGFAEDYFWSGNRKAPCNFELTLAEGVRMRFFSNDEMHVLLLSASL